MPHIFVDADACPVKAEIYRVSQRYNLCVTLVACSAMRFPDNIKVTLEIVAQGMDAADDWIVGQIRAYDIVITGDIPLAARCLGKMAFAVGYTGKPFTPENIGSALATRELFSRLRESGDLTGGPPPFSKKDRSRFLQALDETINSIRRSKKKG